MDKKIGDAIADPQYLMFFNAINSKQHDSLIKMILKWKMLFLPKERRKFSYSKDVAYS